MQPPRRVDRAAIEKRRRTELKNLHSRLASLLPHTNNEKVPLTALVEKTINYVKHLKERIDNLKVKRDQLQALVPPTIEINEMGSSLEVNLIAGLNKSFMMHEVLSILEQEGAQVVSANCTTSNDRILYTIRSEAFSSRIGIDTSRVHERLKMLTGAGIASQSITQRRQ